MTANTAQLFESFIPVYDQVPAEWRDARPFLVEQLKQIANGTNIREIGWYITTPILTGKAYNPSVTSADAYRQIFRLVVEIGPLIAGVNTVNHGITFDANFRLIDLWVNATNNSTPRAMVLTDTSVVMNKTTLSITSPYVFTQSSAIIEYLLEI
jgi:hypothetical protein